MKHLLLTLLGTALAGIVCAQEPTEKAPIVLKTYAEYGYNNTWEHFGHIAVGGYFPINTYFDLQAGIDLCTANSYAIDGRATVRFPLRVGQLALENRLLYRAIVCSRTHEACAALSLGLPHGLFCHIDRRIQPLLQCNAGRTSHPNRRLHRRTIQSAVEHRRTCAARKRFLESRIAHQQFRRFSDRTFQRTHFYPYRALQSHRQNSPVCRSLLQTIGHAARRGQFLQHRRTHQT